MSPDVNVQVVFLLLGSGFWQSYSAPSLCPNYKKCDCSEPVKKTFEVECNWVRDMSSLNGLFNDELRYKPVARLEIQRCKAVVLPKSVFHYTNIQRMDLDCPFRQMEDDALSSVETLSELRLLSSNFLRIPNAVGALTDLKVLRISEGSLEEIHFELQYMASLRKLILKKNRIWNVSGAAFTGNPNLRAIDLSDNGFKNLEPGTFSACLKLEQLLLHGNNLRSVDGLFNISSLKKINLRNNQLESIAGAFRHPTELEELNLGKNPLKDMSEEVFGAGAEHLRTLRLDSCNLMSLPDNLLHRLHKLQCVDLSHNKLTSVPTELFHNLHNLEEIDLSRNEISTLDGIFRHNQRLQRLLLNRNKMEKCGSAFHGMQSLRELKLNINPIQAITETDFSTAPLIEVLDLNFNNISRIDSDAFVHLKLLRNLSLSSNKRIRSLNGSVRDLPQLMSLLLHNNKIGEIDASEMQKMPALKQLNLGNNNLTTVQGAFVNLGNLTRLTLNQNNLVTLTRSSFPKIIKIQKIYVSINNWVCDCRLSWLRDWLTTENLGGLRQRLICDSPERFHGKALSQLTASDLQLWPEECPTSCECTCIPEDVGYFIRVDCSNRGLTKVPEVFPDAIGELDLQDNAIESPIELNIVSSAHLKSLNLERNSLTSMDFYLPNNLEILRLAENYLTQFNFYLPHTLRKCTLSENPWICDCKALEFRNWLIKEREKVMDADSILCSLSEGKPALQGKVIISLSELELCPERMVYYVLGGVALILTILVGVSLLVYFRYRYHLKVWLYSRGFWWLKKRDERDVRKLYDAYISFCEDDLLLVRQLLLPELEQQEPYYSLFIPPRDEQAGEFEFNSLVEEMANSKRAIFLISEQYVKNEFLMEVFRVAFASCLEEGLSRIILIIVGDIPPLSELDQSLKVTIESTKCIRVGQKLFWEMLRFAMPEKSVYQENYEPESNDGDVPLLSNH